MKWLHGGRAKALVLCIGLVLIAFFSFSVLSIHSAHECSDIECHTCELMQHAIRLLRQFDLVSAAVVALTVLAVGVFALLQAYLLPLALPSLVTLKVRLNN